MMNFVEEARFARKVLVVTLGQDLVGLVEQLAVEQQLVVLRQVEQVQWAFPKDLRLYTCLRRI
jgi:hypothetical protein